ncbi:hypothetical protein E2562_009046 [Oryza meyeriana var. granulata]|uniref:Uncharacterized protein n=1 Tax=Oryza meyeriana var. granulata TaxID=110450 RepID=A0A6G1D0Y8_9ORYZ|nr:hypothetical protein E2562_009046 [Oryza meyeriana var. granulata]
MSQPAPTTVAIVARAIHVAGDDGVFFSKCYLSLASRIVKAKYQMIRALGVLLSAKPQLPSLGRLAHGGATAATSTVAIGGRQSSTRSRSGCSVFFSPPIQHSRPQEWHRLVDTNAHLAEGNDGSNGE